MIAIKDIKMPVNCEECFARILAWCRLDEEERMIIPALPDELFEGRPEWCPLVDVPDIVGKCSEIPNSCESLQSTCNEVATDCISRQTTADEIGKRAERCAERFGTDDPFWEGLMIAKNIVECAPSVQPERKKGKWIPVDSFSAFGGDEALWMAHGNPVAFYYCSNCKEQAYAGEDGQSLITDFCQSCGAYMRGEQE